MDADLDLDLARRAADAGAAVAMRYFAGLADLPREVKSDGSVVTEADRASEAAIRAVLAAERPGDALLGEEGGRTGAGGRRWIIDPIDGTAHFVAGDDRWLVLVALEEAGRIVVGVAAVPAQGRVWWARRGAGAYESGPSSETPRSGSEHSYATPPFGSAHPYATPPLTAVSRAADGVRRISVASAPSALADCRLSTFAPHPEVAAPLTAVLPDRPWPLHPGLLVARGDLDLAVQTAGQVWDFAATSLIVEEAGGRYSGLDARPGPGPGPSLYSCGGAVHDEALAVLRG